MGRPRKILAEPESIPILNSNAIAVNKDVVVANQKRTGSIYFNNLNYIIFFLNIILFKVETREQIKDQLQQYLINSKSKRQINQF